MVKYVYAIYDSKAEVFSFPFFMMNRAMAVRAFVGTIMDAQSEIAKFPADYELFELGTWNDESGSFACGIPVSLGRGSSYGRGQGDLFDVNAIKKESVS